MHKLTNLSLAPGEDERQLRTLAAERLGVRAEDIEELVLTRRGLDARRRGAIRWVCSVRVRLRGEAPEPEERYEIPRPAAPGPRPVVAGFGPAGIFAALVLARAGLRPIVLERGPCMEERQRAVAAFRAGGSFDPEANVQFGEGGAGAFSDGKLGTGTHDARIAFVLDSLIEHGAKPSIAYDAKPHLGTDVLSRVVVSLRREIESLGGEVINAASEPGGLVTNGMSWSGRAGKNANAALLVSVSPGDFPYPGPLGGALWQREIERRAFEYAGGYLAPAQLVADFLASRPSSGPGRVLPSAKPGVFWGDLRRVLPAPVTDAMAEALPLLGRKLRGFDAPDAVLTGPETRSSSPVRIPRDAGLCAAVRGLYPCGEGAGWAGGITSAAVDGMKCAEALIASFGA